MTVSPTARWGVSVSAGQADTGHTPAHAAAWRGHAAVLAAIGAAGGVGGSRRRGLSCCGRFLSILFETPHKGRGGCSIMNSLADG